MVMGAVILVKPVILENPTQKGDFKDSLKEVVFWFHCWKPIFNEHLSMSKKTNSVDEVCK